MTRRSSFKQCDVKRAIKAAKAAGATRVTVNTDGSVTVDLIEQEEKGNQKLGWPKKADFEIVL